MKKYLITGFLFLMPAVLTLMIVVFLFDLFTDPLVNVVKSVVNTMTYRFDLHFSQSIVLVLSRLFAFVITLGLILLLGALIRWFFGKNLLHITNRLLDQIPIVRTVYKTSRDLLNAFFATEGPKAFHYPVLIPFTSLPCKGVAFAAGQMAKEFQAKVSEPLSPVFVPTAPHPLSGFLLLIPNKDIQKLPMSNEQAFKFLVSCGTTVPPAEQ